MQDSTLGHSVADFLHALLQVAVFLPDTYEFARYICAITVCRQVGLREDSDTKIRHFVDHDDRLTQLFEVGAVLANYSDPFKWYDLYRAVESVHFWISRGREQNDEKKNVSGNVFHRAHWGRVIPDERLQAV